MGISTNLRAFRNGGLFVHVLEPAFLRIEDATIVGAGVVSFGSRGIPARDGSRLCGSARGFVVGPFVATRLRIVSAGVASRAEQIGTVERTASGENTGRPDAHDFFKLGKTMDVWKRHGFTARD